MAILVLKRYCWTLKNTMELYKYGKIEIDHLKRRDKKLGVAIDRIGAIEREVTPDLFTALVKSIVTQQTSTKAADTVAADVSEIQKCGLCSTEEVQNTGPERLKLLSMAGSL